MGTLENILYRPTEKWEYLNRNGLKIRQTCAAGKDELVLETRSGRAAFS